MRDQPIDVFFDALLELGQALAFLKTARDQLITQPFGLGGVAAIERLEQPIEPFAVAAHEALGFVDVAQQLAADTL